MTDERRLVTVLFADVAGSTALGDSLDPEDLRALLSRYYDIAKDVVSAHGGTVEKFIGDAVMAVFGLPQAHGDDAARAIAAALELRDRVRSDTRLGDRLPIRLGVNTGEVVASRADEGSDFLVTGDAVNVAARLEQAASQWSVMVGDRTMRAARGQFRFGPQQTVEAKGKPGGIGGSEALGPARGSSARTPLFGRQSDLEQLSLVARRAFNEKRPYLVSVIAPPGTGKTRLLEEFLGGLGEIDANAHVAIAQCLPYGQQLTYWPLRAVLFRIVGLSEEATTDEIRGAVAGWLREKRVEDALEIGALLSSTVGAGETEASDSAALFAAWRTFIETAAADAPLVLAFEDLHWSSDTLLDLFEFVLQPRADSPVVVLALARPELLDRRPTWGGGRRNHVSIALEPLDDRSVADLVRHLSEGLPDAFVNAVVKRAEGNPFFATEIVNGLLERQATFDDPAAVQDALERLPDNVQATVLARLDLLPESERDVIRLGAVFGRTFRPAGVAALGDAHNQADVESACEQLLERDMIRPSGADGYAFRHIIIREVAYGTLPRTSRARLHGAAARWLEEGSAGREEAVAELIAYHYREAATLATALELDDADALRAKALDWLIRAAEVARASAATLEARQHVRAAIEFASQDDLPELQELLADVEIGGTLIVDIYEKALELARAAGRGADMELRLLAKAIGVETRSQGSVANRMTEEHLAELRTRGRALMAESTSVDSRARFLVADAFYPFWVRGSSGPVTEEMLSAAEESAKQGLALARELDDANLQSAALDALGSIAQERTDWGQSVAFGMERVAMSSRLALFERLDAHSVITWGAVIMGDLATAERISADGLAIIQPRQAPQWALHLVAWRCVTLLWTGNWDEVEHVGDRAYQMWLEADQPAAGYAQRGFATALRVARARRDDPRMDRHQATMLDILSRFDVPVLTRGTPSYAEGDIEGVATYLESLAGTQITSRWEYVAFFTSVCSDSGRLLDPKYLDGALTDARDASSRLLEAETLRAQGLSQSDPVLLDQAREILAAAGALPYVARARAEAAILRRDRAELDAAIAYLESIRDEVQVERYLREGAGIK